jgi:hypothetical protein
MKSIRIDVITTDMKAETCTFVPNTRHNTTAKPTIQLGVFKLVTWHDVHCRLSVFAGE